MRCTFLHKSFVAGEHQFIATDQGWESEQRVGFALRVHVQLRNHSCLVDPGGGTGEGVQG